MGRFFEYLFPRKITFSLFAEFSSEPLRKTTFQNYIFSGENFRGKVFRGIFLETFHGKKCTKDRQQVNRARDMPMISQKNSQILALMTLLSLTAIYVFSPIVAGISKFNCGIQMSSVKNVIN
jgi:hypothetical protein